MESLKNGRLALRSADVLAFRPREIEDELAQSSRKQIRSLHTDCQLMGAQQVRPVARIAPLHAPDEGKIQHRITSVTSPTMPPSVLAACQSMASGIPMWDTSPSECST